MALQAAVSGMGVAMGRRSLQAEALRDGRLVAPFPAGPSGYRYDLICPAGEEKRPRFAAFAGWLAAQGWPSMKQARQPERLSGRTALVQGLCQGAGIDVLKLAAHRHAARNA